MSSQYVWLYKGTALFYGCTLVHPGDYSAFTYYRGLNRKWETDHTDSTGGDCVCTDGVCGVRECVLQMCFCCQSCQAPIPPLRTVEEGRFCAVYTVNGQELCSAFIIVAGTQKHCCSISHISQRKMMIYCNFGLLFLSVIERKAEIFICNCHLEVESWILIPHWDTNKGKVEPENCHANCNCIISATSHISAVNLMTVL